jgi:hypothetical protein
MRRLPLPLALFVVVTAAACPDPVGEVETCSFVWTCDDQEVSDDATDFCTNPASRVRQAELDAYVEDRCGSTVVQCLDGSAAECKGSCKAAGECAIEDVEQIE